MTLVIGNRYRVTFAGSAGRLANRWVEGVLVRVIEKGGRLSLEEVVKYYGSVPPSEAFGHAKVKSYVLQRITTYEVYPDHQNYKWEEL